MNVRGCTTIAVAHTVYNIHVLENTIFDTLRLNTQLTVVISLVSSTHYTTSISKNIYSGRVINDGEKLAINLGTYRYN